MFPSHADLCIQCVQEAADVYVLQNRLKDEWKTISKYLASHVLNSNVSLLSGYFDNQSQPQGLKLKCLPNGSFEIQHINTETSVNGLSNGTDVSGETDPSVVELMQNDDLSSSSSSFSPRDQSSACVLVNRVMMRDWKNLRKEAAGQKVYTFVSNYRLKKSVNVIHSGQIRVGSNQWP